MFQVRELRLGDPGVIEIQCPACGRLGADVLRFHRDRAVACRDCLDSGAIVYMTRALSGGMLDRLWMRYLLDQDRVR